MKTRIGALLESKLLESEKKFGSITVSVEKYSWGTLRVLRMGSSYTAVIHPDQFDLLKQVWNGQKSSSSFKDEQKVVWTVSKDQDNLILKSGSNVFKLNQGIMDFLGD